MTRHEGDILRASTPLGSWVAACACGWTGPDVYPTAGEAATAVGRHVLDHNPTTAREETP